MELALNKMMKQNSPPLIGKRKFQYRSKSECINKNIYIYIQLSSSFFDIQNWTTGISTFVLIHIFISQIDCDSHDSQIFYKFLVYPFNSEKGRISFYRFMIIIIRKQTKQLICIPQSRSINIYIVGLGYKNKCSQN